MGKSSLMLTSDLFDVFLSTRCVAFIGYDFSLLLELLFITWVKVFFFHFSDCLLLGSNDKLLSILLVANLSILTQIFKFLFSYIV